MQLKCEVICCVWYNYHFVVRTPLGDKIDIVEKKINAIIGFFLGEEDEKRAGSCSDCLSNHIVC